MRGRTAKKVWEDYAEICAFAIASYTILALFGIRATIDNFLDSEATIDWAEILIATFIAVILALFASFVHQTRILNQVGWKIGVTTLQTDEEIWEIFHEETGEWVFVRDLKHNLSRNAKRFI